MIALDRKGHCVFGAIELPLQQRGWQAGAEGIQEATRVRYEPCCRTGKLYVSGSTTAAGAGYGTDARLEGGCVLLHGGRVKKHQH